MLLGTHAFAAFPQLELFGVYMKRSPVVKFYQQYFAATQSVSAGWLARLTASQRLKMLEDLMQWEVTTSTTVKY